MHMPGSPTASYRVLRRGFSLLELLAVISILVVAMLVFVTVLGSGSAGPPLERSSVQLSTMVANIRQNASVRKVHSELVLDYVNDRAVALARRRLITFAFEDDVASGNIIGRRAGGAEVLASRWMNLRDGKCLDLPTPQASFTLPWNETFEVTGDYEGLAVAFDYCPTGASTGNVATMGSAFAVTVAAARPDCVQLALACGGASVQSATWLALYRWHTVEVAVSRYGVHLYIDGRLDSAPIKSSFTVPSAVGSDLRIGGTSCRVDNLELFTLVSSQTLQLEGVQFIAEGVDPVTEGTGGAEDIYRDLTQPPTNAPVTGPGSGTPGPPGLPPGMDLLPALVHLYYDSSGKLDPARHAGAVDIYLVHYEDGTLRRMRVRFHPLGAVTADELDYFPWETPPNPLGDAG